MRLKLTTALCSVALLAAACGQEVETPVTDDAAVVDPGLGTTQVGASCRNVPLDTDNDGIIEQVEYNTWGDASFMDWDRDDDNRISRAEFEQCWNAGGWTTSPANYNWNTAWTGWDDDNDGFLTETEFFGEDEFGEWDENDDMGLEMSEWD